MTRCAYTSRLMSVVGPEVMLNKYNLELKKKKKARKKRRLSLWLYSRTLVLVGKSKFWNQMGVWENCLVKIRSIEKVMPSLCKTRGVSAVLTECSLLGDSEIAARSSRQGALGQLHVGGLFFFFIVSIGLWFTVQVIKSEKLPFHKLGCFSINVVGCLCC